MKPDLEAARAVLRNCLLFHSLAPDVLDKLVARVQIRRFAPRETIIWTGPNRRNSLMAVLSGSVQISAVSPEGREILLAIFHPGEVFGEIALLDGKERSADVRAKSDCTVATLERAEVLDLLEHHPEAWRGFVEVLCARLRNTDDHLVEIALLDLPARLARTVLRTASVQVGSASAPKTKVLQLSQQDLGNMVAASRERVNHWLQEWQRAGIVRVEKGSIAILDEAALEHVTHPSRQLHGIHHSQADPRPR
jgi:CRP-like cAMP-binding protein